VDILLVPIGPGSDDAVATLREAAGVYGWALEETDAAESESYRSLRVVPDTCTRAPEARRVLERARMTAAGVVADVRAERREPAERR
jgi:hypothetical protein